MPETSSPKTRVALIDDDFHDVTYAKLPAQTRQIFDDETSEDYSALLAYLTKEKLIPESYNPDEPDSVEDYFGSEEFEAWLRVSDGQAHGLPFIDLAVTAHREGLNFSVYQNILAAFPESEFQVDCFLERPDPRDLVDYDLIFMDVQIKGDELDTADKVADYLNEVKSHCESGSLPIMVLMSVETRLEQYRSSVRQRAKMSALSFHIINKSAMNVEHAVENLQLLWSSTEENKETAKMIGALHEALSSAFTRGWESTEQLLWNMDAASLHSMYQTIVNVEKMPFDEGILEMVNKHYLHCVEETIAHERQFDSVLSHFEERGPALYPSLASESLDASHNLQASLYASGAGEAPQPEIVSFEEDMEAYQVMSMLPFGAFISEDKGSSVGTTGLLNITQLCDLSKHITKYDDRYLRFIEASIVAESDAIKPSSNFVRVWPIKLPKEGSERLYMRIDSKISSYTAQEILGQMAGTHQTLIRLRPEFVRQLREDLFQKLSSYEAQPAYQPMVGLGRPYLVFKGNQSGKVYDPVLVNGEHKQYRAIEKQSPKSMAFYENDMIDFSVSLSKQMAVLRNGADIPPKEILDSLRDGVPKNCGNTQTSWGFRCFDQDVTRIEAHRSVPTLYFDMVEDREMNAWEAEGNIRRGADEDKKS